MGTGTFVTGRGVKIPQGLFYICRVVAYVACVSEDVKEPLGYFTLVALCGEECLKHGEAGAHIFDKVFGDIGR